MKRLRWLMVGMLLLAVGAACIAGCGGSTSSSSSTKEVTASDLGVPIYPGAKQVEAGDMGQGQPPSGGPGGPQGSAPSRPDDSGNMQPPSGSTSPQGSAPSGQSPRAGGPGGNMTTFLTTDSYDKVVAWYKDKLSGKTDFKEGAMGGPRGNASQGQSQGSAPAMNSGNSTVFTFTSGDTTKMVMIREASNGQSGTYITIGDMPSGTPQDQQSGQST